MVIGAGPRAHRELEQHIPSTQAPLVTFDGYRIRWWLLLACGVIAIWLAESPDRRAHGRGWIDARRECDHPARGAHAGRPACLAGMVGDPDEQVAVGQFDRRHPGQGRQTKSQDQGQSDAAEHARDAGAETPAEVGVVHGRTTPA